MPTSFIVASHHLDRAVLFGILGAFLLFAAFRPAWHTPALVGTAAHARR